MMFYHLYAIFVNCFPHYLLLLCQIPIDLIVNQYEYSDVDIRVVCLMVRVSAVVMILLPCLARPGHHWHGHTGQPSHPAHQPQLQHSRQGGFCSVRDKYIKLWMIWVELNLCKLLFLFKINVVQCVRWPRRPCCWSAHVTTTIFPGKLRLYLVSRAAAQQPRYVPIMSGIKQRHFLVFCLPASYGTKIVLVVVQINTI